MSRTIETLKAARAWQREHGRPPEVIYVTEARLREISGEALRPDGRGPALTPEEIDECIRQVRAGENYARLMGVALDIDDALTDDDVVPAELPRSLYAGGPDRTRIVGPEREALLMQSAIDDPRIQVAFDARLEHTGAQLIPAAVMLASAGVDHPVLVLPASARSSWEANPGPTLIHEYTGPLPDAPNAGTARRFELVKPRKPE